MYNLRFTNIIYSVVADEIGTILKNEKKTAILVTHDIAEAISTKRQNKAN